MIVEAQKGNLSFLPNFLSFTKPRITAATKINALAAIHYLLKTKETPLKVPT